MADVIVSGCSGGGKSTLLGELARRGHAVVPEPGRRAVAEGILPWRDPRAFAERLVAIALDDLAGPAPPGWRFFDRGLIDALAALAHASGTELRGADVRRFHPLVFMAPPWPEIYVNDAGRPQALADGIAEYERLVPAYRALGYEIVELPRASVAERAGFVLAGLAGCPLRRGTSGSSR